MPKTGIIRMAAVAGTLLLAGCAARLDPAQEETPISFSAGCTLLRDDATKSAAIITGTSFEANDHFAVFGWHKYEAVPPSSTQWIFENHMVEYQNASQCTYTGIRIWNWQSGSHPDDYYDFIGVYPYQSGLLSDPDFSKSAGATTISVNIPYDSVNSQYDLMGAATRRQYTAPAPGNASNTANYDAVHLTFYHLLSAVKVVIINKGNTPVTLNSICFRNLVVSDVAQLSLVNNSGTYVLSYEWEDPGRDDQNPLFDFPQGYNAPVIGSEEGYSWPENVGHAPDVSGLDTTAPDYLDNLTALLQNYNYYHLLPPQRLNVPANPVLEINYSFEDSTGNPVTPPTTSISLQSILRADESAAITQWEAGKKYTYFVDFNLDGDVQVSVVTTEWEPVNAQTPGVML